jgi:hypothetical protein
MALKQPEISSVPLRPGRDAPSLLLSWFSIELEARIWFATPQRRQTVNLLALRLQWFESSPAHAPAGYLAKFVFVSVARHRQSILIFLKL